MAGTKKTGMVLQSRDRQLLSAFGQVSVLDRELVKPVVGFGSTTRANTRLLKLMQAGLLRRFFIGTIAGGRKAVYTLSDKGRALVGCPRTGFKRKRDENVVGDLFVEHELGIAEVFVIVRHKPIPIADLKSPRWLTFQNPVGASGLIPDAYFELETTNGVRAQFLEVDRGTESLTVWQKKTAAYVQMAASGEFSRNFSRQQFRVLVVLQSERRLHHLRAAIAKVTDKIFWLTTFEFIKRESFWSAVWFRPTGDLRHSLL